MHCNACNRECGLSRFCSPACEAQPRLWPYCQVCGSLIVKQHNRDRRWCQDIRCKWRGHWLLFGRVNRKKVALALDAYVALARYAEEKGVSYSRAVMLLVGEEREEGDDDDRQGKLVG